MRTRAYRRHRRDVRRAKTRRLVDVFAATMGGYTETVKTRLVHLYEKQGKPCSCGMCRDEKTRDHRQRDKAEFRISLGETEVMDLEYSHVPFGDAGTIPVRFTEATPLGVRLLREAAEDQVLSADASSRFNNAIHSESAKPKVPLRQLPMRHLAGND